MRWKAKEKLQIGSRRTITGFALFPKKVGDYWIWLERYSIKQILAKTRRFGVHTEETYTLIDWVDLSVELLDKGVR